MPAVAEKPKTLEIREQMRRDHIEFSKELNAAGITHQEIKDAVRKARANVRKYRHSRSR